jgi:5'-phosphate synthase pdxT subunit
MATIGILALQGDFAEHCTIFARLGIGAREVRLPHHLEGIDGLVIPGGESTTVSRLMDEYGLLTPLRRLAAAGLPLWGTCAGLILLASKTPGLEGPSLELMDITAIRNAFGRQVDSFEANLDVPALGPPPFRAVFIRAPLIKDPGSGVEVLARLDDHTVVAAREGDLLGTAFHPELTEDMRFHRYFLEMVAARDGHRVGAMTGGFRDTP